MKKIVSIIIISTVLVSLLGFTCNADNYEEIWDAVDSQTQKYLEDVGVDEISFNELFEVTPYRVIRFILELAFEPAIKYLMLWENSRTKAQ